jgi:hypothetical protein
MQSLVCTGHPYATRHQSDKTVRTDPLIARVVAHAKPPKCRQHRNRQDPPVRNSNS